MNKEKEVVLAEIKGIRSISIIWLVPVVAILIGAWMIYWQISNQGPSIVIYFKNGNGIVAGKTKIKVKNVEVGLVKELELNDDLSGVIVNAVIQNNDADLLMKDTEFWVVKPRIGKGGVTGLGTLLSGAYIELSPGVSAVRKYKFTGLENEPVTAAGTPGLHITLASKGYHALHVGDPILFRGINVGRIEYVYFNTTERIVYYDAFIESPYDKLVTKNIKFWEVNGIEMNVSAKGVHIQSGTLETMISGGVTFDVPDNMQPGKIVTKREVFTIFPNKDAIYKSRYKYGLHYILLFKDSIRGLNPGAPVEYKGIKVGNVTRTDVAYPEIVHLLDRDTLIPVMIAIEPLDLGYKNRKNVLQARRAMIKLLKQGLHGSIVTGNFLTGSKYIELKYGKGMIGALKHFSGYLVIPTRQGRFGQIIKKMGKLVNKLYNLPLETVANNTGKTLQQVTATLKAFENTAKQLDTLLKQTTDENLVANIKSTLKNIKRLSAEFSTGSLTHQALQNTLSAMQDSLVELKPLLLRLNQQPNSLIFGQRKAKDIEPKGKP